MNTQKSIDTNGIAVDQAASLPSPRRGGSQTGSHRPLSGRRDPGRRWGFHLTRRNGVFYFRRRWPQALRALGAPEFLSVSLRTHVLADAVKRSADLLAAIEDGERKMITELADAPGGEWRTKALIRELVRASISSMMTRLEAPFDAQESATYAASIRQQQESVGTALQARDWSHAAELASDAAELIGLPRQALTDPALAWRILANTRELLKVAFSAEHEFEDPLRLGKALLEENGLKADRASLKPPMLLSEAVEKECEEAPADVAKKIRATGRLAEAYFGNVPVASLTLDEVTAFLKFVWYMLKNWGQLHGKNRYEQVGKEFNPQEIKRKADEKDAALLAKIAADDSLSKPDKRRLLVDLLEAR